MSEATANQNPTPSFVTDPIWEHVQRERTEAFAQTLGEVPEEILASFETAHRVAEALHNKEKDPPFATIPIQAATHLVLVAKSLFAREQRLQQELERAKGILGAINTECYAGESIDFIRTLTEPFSQKK